MMSLELKYIPPEQERVEKLRLIKRKEETRGRKRGKGNGEKRKARPGRKEYGERSRKRKEGRLGGCMEGNTQKKEKKNKEKNESGVGV